MGDYSTDDFLGRGNTQDIGECSICGKGLEIGKMQIDAGWIHRSCQAELSALREWRERAKDVFQSVIIRQKPRIDAFIPDCWHCLDCRGTGKSEQTIKHTEWCLVGRAAALLSAPDSGEWMVVRREDLLSIMYAAKLFYESIADDLPPEYNRLKAALKRGK